MRNVLTTGGIDLSPLITHKFRMDQLDEAFALLQSRQAGKVIVMPPHGLILANPVHFAPSDFEETYPSMLWHDVFNHTASEIITDSKQRELFLLKSELENLLSTAQGLQQTINGLRRQLLNPEFNSKQKSQIKGQLSELEMEQEQILDKCGDIRHRLESASTKSYQ